MKRRMERDGGTDEWIQLQFNQSIASLIERCDEMVKLINFNFNYYNLVMVLFSRIQRFLLKSCNYNSRNAFIIFFSLKEKNCLVFNAIINAKISLKFFQKKT